MFDVIFPEIRAWFLQKETHFATFAEADSRLEGWFKGEMLVLLTALKRQGLVEAYEREFNVPTPSGPKKRRQVDFRITTRSQSHVCELKALCISQAAGTPRDLGFYLRDDEVGMIKDLKKLPDLPIADQLWLLAFVYPNPGPREWDAALGTVSSLVRDWTCRTSPREFPSFLYLSLWGHQGADGT